jgi:hypothetical protein
MAVRGMRQGLGRPLTGLGPSIAMLPSPEEAAVAFAQVTSFIRFWVREVGEDGLPKLLAAIREAPAGTDVGQTIGKLTGVNLAEWDVRWRAYLQTVSTELPPHLAPGGRVPHRREISRRLRLGQLLLERRHFNAAAIELEQAYELAPFAPAVRCHRVAALLGLGEMASAELLVTRPEDIDGRSGRWWSLHDSLHRRNRLARWRALSLEPLNPPVACDEHLPPALPSDDLRRALCEAARRAPR